MIQSRANLNYQSLVIISLALHFSLLIYVFVLYFMGYSSQWIIWTPDWRLLPEKSFLLYVFGGLSMTTAALAIFFPKIVPPIATPTSADAAVMPASSGLFYNFSPLTPAMHSQTIVRMALAEMIAIFGFVLGFLNQAPLVAVPFIVAGLIVQFLVGPIFGRMTSS